MKVRFYFLFLIVFLLAIFKGAGQMTLSYTTVNVSCNGLSDGSITVHVDGGIPPYTYTWSTLFNETKTDTFSIISGQPAGTLYWVQVTDSDLPQNGAYSGFLVITEPPPLVIDSQSSTDVTCHGDADGTITITVSGGTPPYVYSIDGGITFLSNGGIFTGLGGGSYSIAVKDNNDCLTAGGTELITDPPGILFTSQTATDITCFGLTDGTITIGVSGGVPPYLYSIDGGATFQNNGGSYTGLGAGNYDVAVQDANGCAVLGNTLTIIEPTQLIITSQTTTDVLCNGGNDGTITVAASGGIPGYQYSVDAGLTWLNNGGLFTGLAAGNYDIAVRDVNGCITNGSTLNIGQPTALTFDSQTASPVSCFGGSDGTLTITVSGGTPPYQYSNDGGLNFVNNGGSFTGIPAGDYNMAVKDANGCISMGATLTVSQPSQLIIDTQNKTDIVCFGANDGTITIGASGGTPPYEYSINGGSSYVANGGNFSGLAPGNYDISVRDINGCITNGSTLNITEPTQLFVDSNIKTDVSCNGGNDGTISIVASGGTPPYVYSIDGGTNFVNNGGTFSTLIAGIYDVAVRDNNGCITAGSTLTVSEPSQLTIDSENFTNITCGGGSDGTISLAASGGISPYQYSIDSGNTFSNNGGVFNGLTTGNYSVAVRDNNGCITNGSTLNLTEPPAIVIDSVGTGQITCNGYADGILQIYVHGGTPGYLFSIDGGTTFLNNGGLFTGLAAGNYDIAVQDVNNCSIAGQTISLADPPSVVIDTETTSNISCNGLTDGRIQIAASGGSAPYRFSIDNGFNFSNNSDFTGLSAGSYQVVVKDDLGCQTSGSNLSIIEPPALVIDSVKAIDVLCHGGSDGRIEITASGGTSPYLYSVDGGTQFSDNGGIFSTLTTGSYSIAVKDQNGCLKTGSILSLNEPPPLTMSLDTTRPSCNKYTADGSILVISGGGNPGYNYSADGGLNWQTGNLFNNLPAGPYDIVIRDQNNCTLSNTITLESKYTVVANAGRDTSMCPGGQVTLFGSGGDTYQWSPSSGLSDPNISSPVAFPAVSTQYTLKVSKGICSDEDSVRVVVFDVPEINAGNDTAIFKGSSIQLRATPGDFATYFWSPSDGLSGTSGAIVTAMPPEDILYRITGTTFDGCISSDSVMITVFKEFLVPSGFTPNQDGYNDTWEIDNAWLFPNIVVEVVNRWGQRVFYSKGYGKGQEWDGTRNGKDLPLGTYYYIIILNDGLNTRPLTGPVTIVR